MKILLVDDHSVVRHGYRMLLETMLENVVVHEAQCTQSCLDKLSEQQYCIIVLDINLDGESGLVLAKQIFALYPHQDIIFFSMYEDINILNQAMQLGAKGYISKSSQAHTMLTAIKEVSLGRIFIEQQFAKQMADLLLGKHAQLEDVLTKREFDIFMLLAKRYKRQQIADELAISSKTISNYITSIKQKLDIKHTQDARDYALRHGYVF